MSTADQHKLLQLLELSNLIIYAQIRQIKQSTFKERGKHGGKQNLQKIIERETDNGLSFNLDIFD